MTKFGLRTHNIMPYEQSLIERLREVYEGGLPASILLHIDRLCNGHCYDRATLISQGMDKFDLVWGSIRGIRIRQCQNLTGQALMDESNHCWVERNGWVYDTSSGYRTKKWLYYLVERPIIRRRKNQDWCKKQAIYRMMSKHDFERDKWVLPIIIPLIEIQIPTVVNSERAAFELNLFKQKIDYEAVCLELKADMVAKGFG